MFGLRLDRLEAQLIHYPQAGARVAPDKCRLRGPRGRGKRARRSGGTPKRGHAMSAAEAPKSEQIQANVAAALSRLRGELGAASSPVASATPIPLPKIGAEPVPAEPLMPEPLPAGPVRMENTAAVRPFEPILSAMAAGNSNSAASNDSAPAPMEGAKPDLF